METHPPISANPENPIVWRKGHEMTEVSVCVGKRGLSFMQWLQNQLDRHVSIPKGQTKEFEKVYTEFSYPDESFRFFILPCQSTMNIQDVEMKAVENNLVPLELAEIFFILNSLESKILQSFGFKWLLFMSNQMIAKSIIEISLTDCLEIKLTNPETVFNSLVGFVYKEKN